MKKIKINRERIDQLSLEDTLPLMKQIKSFTLGKQKPDSFTRFIFNLNFTGWLLLFGWNTLSFIALSFSDLIKEEKGFSVNAIIRRQGREYGFEGQDFLDNFYVYLELQFIILSVLLVGITLLYRKKKSFAFLFFGAFLFHFASLFYLLGIQYFIEDITLFDKLLYAVMLISGGVSVWVLRH